MLLDEIDMTESTLAQGLDLVKLSDLGLFHILKIGLGRVALGGSCLSEVGCHGLDGLEEA